MSFSFTVPSMPDMRNMGLGYSVSLCKHGLRFIACSDSRNIAVRNLAVPMVKPVMVPSLFTSVGVIFSNSPYAKMLRIDARRIIASVHQYFPFRNWPNKLLINPTVGTNANPVFASTNGNYSIAPSTRNFISSPKPASTRFFDSRFQGNWSDNTRIFIKFPMLVGFHVAKFAKISAECLIRTKQAFFLSLFHNNLQCVR